MTNLLLLVTKGRPPLSLKLELQHPDYVLSILTDLASLLSQRSDLLSSASF